MEYCTIQEFHRALRDSSLFATIKPLNYDDVHRTTHFGECSAVVNSRRVIIHAPITPKAMELAEEVYALLRGERGETIGTFSILHNELATDNGKRVSIIIEDIPEGTPLELALLTHPREQLLKGLNELRERLRRADISHNNLRKHNITVDREGRWHLSRLYYATVGYGGNCEQLNAIGEEIEANALKSDCACEPLSSYKTEYQPLREGRRKTQTARGVGFEDETGRMVIRDCYAWASDFDEGRAMVMTHDHKMGLIDTEGHEVIRAEYEIVEYSAREGNSWVRRNELWALFDYSGLQITEWLERDIVDEDIEL